MENATEQVANGEVGQASSTPSQPEVSSGGPTAGTFSPEQEKFITETVTKAVQSMKDVRFQKLENEQVATKAQIAETQSEVRKQFARVKAYMEQHGVSEERAIVEIERDDKIDAVLQQREAPATGPVSQASEQVDLSAVKTKLVDELKLSMDDPTTKEFLNGLTITDPTELATEIAKFAVQRSSTRPQGSAAEILSTPTGAPVNPDLQKQYEAEINALQQSRQAGNIQMIMDIKAKYREKGLQLY